MAHLLCLDEEFAVSCSCVVDTRVDKCILVMQGDTRCDPRTRAVCAISATQHVYTHAPLMGNTTGALGCPTQSEWNIIVTF
jgi:hypothetical protein